MRTVEKTTDKPDLTIEQILSWADAHHEMNGSWPNKKSGHVLDTGEIWSAIDAALYSGVRGLTRGSSLPRLLAEHRGVRNQKDLPVLTIKQILSWADEHHTTNGSWPTGKSGPVSSTDETWMAINTALNIGNRGLPGGSSLAQVLAEHRGVKNLANLSTLTIDQILNWADAHQVSTGKWPNTKSGAVMGTDETWSAINSALKRGIRGLSGGSTLAQLLEKHREVRNHKNLPTLSIEQILKLADAHQVATGKWPNDRSGPVLGTDGTWLAINIALNSGGRGLPGGSTLAKLLAEHRGVRNRMGLQDLTIEQILSWADAHQAATGSWPKKNSGQVANCGETWSAIDQALKTGGRGLQGGETLLQLLAKHRDIKFRKNLPRLTVEQILDWADMHQATTGSWPNRNSGTIANSEETWNVVDQALKARGRGLPGGSSLAKLLAEQRGVRNRKGLPTLTIEHILKWADAHRTATGSWPNSTSGPVLDTQETWMAINGALIAGCRGLPDRSTLAQFLAEHRGVKNLANLSTLTIDQILNWADAHQVSTGKWPNTKSGAVMETEESWASVDSALRIGRRGLPGGSSLAQVLAEHRAVRNIQGLPALTIDQILKWADAYRNTTGKWPKKKSGPVAGTNEHWSAIQAALQAGARGLPGGSSLAKLLMDYRGVKNSANRPSLTTAQILFRPMSTKLRRVVGQIRNQDSS